MRISPVRAGTALLALLLIGGCTGSGGDAKPTPTTAAVATSAVSSGYVAVYRGLRIPGWALERYGDTDSMDVGIRSLAGDPGGKTMTLRLGITAHLPSGAVDRPTLGGMFSLTQFQPVLTDRANHTLYRQVDAPDAGDAWLTQAGKTPVADGVTVDTSFTFTAPQKPVSVLDVSLQPRLPTFFDVPVTGGGGPAPRAWSGAASGPGGAPGYGFAGGSVPVVAEQKGMPIKGWVLSKYTAADTVDAGVQSLALDPGGATMTLRLVLTPRLVSAEGSAHHLSPFDINGAAQLSPGLVDRTGLRRYDVLEVTRDFERFRAAPDDLYQVSHGNSLVLAYTYTAPKDPAATLDLTVGENWPPLRGLKLGAVAPAADPTPTTPTPTVAGATAGPAVGAGKTFTAKQLADAVVVFPLNGVTELARARGRSLTLGTDVLFDFGSARLGGAARSTLTSRLAKIPKGARVTVVGYTDSIGSTSSNLALSKRRAKAVATAIQAARSDLTSASYGQGESDPVADNGTPKNDNPAGRAKNRRVEVSWK